MLSFFVFYDGDGGYSCVSSLSYSSSIENVLAYVPLTGVHMYIDKDTMFTKT